MRARNELGRVLGMIEAFRAEGETRQRFARRHRLHPSALSRILRVAELPGEVLSELERLPHLSRTHLEVLAAAPLERRPALLDAVREGRSTYSLRSRTERSARVAFSQEEKPVFSQEEKQAPCPAPPAPEPPARRAIDARLEAVARSLEASPEETLAFAGELLLVLWKSNPRRVLESFESFKAARARSSEARG